MLIGQSSNKCMMLGWGSTSSGFVCSRSTYSGTRCVLKSPCSLLRLGDASYVRCTALHLVATVNRARAILSTKISNGNLSHEFVRACFISLILCFVGYGNSVASMSSGDFRSFLRGVLIFLCENANPFA